MIGFLKSIDALALGASPWPTLDPNMQHERIDWGALFPSRSQRDTLREGFPSIDPWQERLNDSFLDQLRAALQSEPTDDGESCEGWDVCAWYQPIHYFGPNWGIYIKEECVMRCALRIARRYRGLFASHAVPAIGRACIRAALCIYFLHEHYHHKIECLGFRIEVATGCSTYIPYHQKVYSPLLGTDLVLEEALANADSYLRLSVSPYVHWITPDIMRATRSYLESRFPIDPPGYRMAMNYLNQRSFNSGENKLQAQFAEGSQTPLRAAGNWDMAPRMVQSIFNVKSNIWTVLSPGVRSILPTKPRRP